VLGDNQPGPHAQHRARFVQDDLAQARILLGLFGQLHRPRPRRDFVQIDDAAFRLGDDFLRHDQDIEIFWRHIVKPENFQDQTGQIISRMDIGKPHRHPDRQGTHQNSEAGNGKREATSRSVSSFPFPVSVISLIKARDLNAEITAPVPLVDGHQHPGQLFEDARVGQRTRIDRPHADGADQMGDTLFRPLVIATQ